MRRYKSIFQEAGQEEFKKTEILKNPSLGELKKLASAKIDKGQLGSIRGVLNNNDAYFWNNESLLHKHFLDNQHLSGIKITN